MPGKPFDESERTLTVQLNCGRCKDETRHLFQESRTTDQMIEGKLERMVLVMYRCTDCANLRLWGLENAYQTNGRRPNREKAKLLL